MSQSWLRLPVGLVYINTTTPKLMESATAAIQTSDPDSVSLAAGELTYQTARTAAKGADTGLSVVATDIKVALTQANAGF